MPTHSGNLPEQERSIKSRAHELFVKPQPDSAARPTKPFPVYLKETPAFPMSSTVKAMLFFAAIIVGLLFLAAVWKLSIRHGPRRQDPPRSEAVKTSDGRPASFPLGSRMRPPDAVFTTLPRADMAAVDYARKRPEERVPARSRCRFSG
jgi:hypothetical protein